MSYGDGNGNGKRNGNGHHPGSQLIDASVASQFERLPPWNEDAEKCTIASMLLDKGVCGEVLEIIHREVWFSADHQIIFDVLVKLWEENKAIDAVIVSDELKKRGLLEEIGGILTLADILNKVPSAAHGIHYAGIVKQHWLLRRVIEECNNGLRGAYAPHNDAREVIEKLERGVFAIAEEKSGACGGVEMSQVLMEVFEQLESRGQRGLETGFFELDEMLNGLQNGEMIVLAARPSQGKTALALNFIEHIAGVNRIPCGMFSLEMSKQALAQRLMCSQAQIDSHKLRKGLLRSDEYTKLADTVGTLSKAQIIVDDSGNLNPLALRAGARRMKLKHDIRCLVIDYMQLMDASEQTASKEGRQQQVTEISRTIKSVARELDIPVVALSQLNRSVEGREGHRPRLSDLRESGSIEQDADVVMLLHREDYYRMSEPNFQPDNLAEVIIAKQRNGPVGTVKLMFVNKSARFENLSMQNDPFM